MIRVLIADDHVLVRRAIVHMLKAERDICVAGEASDSAEALRLALETEHDVFILDLGMPGRGGVDVLATLRAQRPRAAVLVLSMYDEREFGVRVIKAGAAGFVAKSSAPEELVRAVREVAGGGRYISPALGRYLAEGVCQQERERPHEELSERERQVFGGLTVGKSITEIAADLSLSVKTVSTYRARVLEKMQLRHNADIVRYAVANGLVA
jgi:DNA-binding NarL/FixJ family response regulator